MIRYRTDKIEDRVCVESSHGEISAGVICSEISIVLRDNEYNEITIILDRQEAMAIGKQLIKVAVGTGEH